MSHRHGGIRGHSTKQDTEPHFLVPFPPCSELTANHFLVSFFYFGHHIAIFLPGLCGCTELIYITQNNMNTFSVTIISYQRLVLYKEKRCLAHSVKALSTNSMAKSTVHSE